MRTKQKETPNFSIVDMEVNKLSSHLGAYPTVHVNEVILTVISIVGINRDSRDNAHICEHSILNGNVHMNTHVLYYIAM
jgi:hypothetical protein